MWDRIKFLVILALVMVAIIAGSDDLGFLPFGEVIAEFFSSSTGIILGSLFLLEFLRQLHYLLSENSAAYNSFWQDSFFGGFERWTHRHFKPWTRFRVARFIRWGFYLFLIGLLVDYFVPEVQGVLQAIVELPRLIVGALPFVFQLMFGFFFVILQFVGLFWFLSRGGMDVILPEEVTTRFDDVWGQDHVLDLIKENIAFLEKPDEIEKKGGYIPGGILLWGPPGTGKTLMAQAIAGETGRPYVFVEPGAFINMFMGIGVLKVKGLYRKLRKLSLRHGGVIVFFDEADALGSRGGMGAPQGQFGQSLHDRPRVHLQRVQLPGRPQPERTCRALEPDRADHPRRGAQGGMDQSDHDGRDGGRRRHGHAAGPAHRDERAHQAARHHQQVPQDVRVPAKAAAQVPDPPHHGDQHAQRPRRGHVAPWPHRPDLQGGISLEGGPEADHRRLPGQGRPHAQPEQVEQLAVITPYYSGASIKDLVNEALIIAVRDGREAIEWPDVWRAKSLKELGPPEDVDYIQRERHAVAVHEACHAVTAHLLGAHRRIDMVSIEKRASTLGMVKIDGRRGALHPMALRVSRPTSWSPLPRSPESACSSAVTTAPALPATCSPPRPWPP